MWLPNSFRKWFSRRNVPIQNPRRIANRNSVKLTLEPLEPRLAPAVVTYTSLTQLLDFTADGGDTDNVTVTSPGANALRIVVANGDTISLVGDVSLGFTLSVGNTQLDVNTSTNPIAQFDINLGDMGDTLAFGLANPVIGNVDIDGEAGTDAVTLNALHITGNLTVASETITLAGLVAADGDVSLTALNGLTDGPDNDTAHITGNVVTLNVTGGGNQIGGGTADFLEIDAATRLDAATNNGNMFLKNVTGNLPLGALNAGNAFIFLTARNGAITDGNGAAVNLTAAKGVSLTTTGNNSAIGTSLDPIETAIEALSATTYDGGIYIADSNGPGLIINSVLANEGGQVPFIDGSNQIVIFDPLPSTSNPHPGTKDVSISAQADILLNTVTAPNMVTITSVAGRILDINQASNNILARSENLVANGTVGQDSDPIESTVEAFSASTTSGPIFLAQLLASTAVSVVAGGAGNDVSVTASGASLRIQTITAPGDVTVANSGGSLLDDNGAAVNITGLVVNLTGKSGIGTALDPLETNTADLRATVSDAAAGITPAAAIFIDNKNGGLVALSSVAAKTNAGDVTINFLGGPLTFVASTQVLNASGAAVTFETTSGDVKLGLVDAGSSVINITAAGAIMDDINDAAVDLRGGIVTLHASTGIGASGNEIDTDVATLNATTNSGGIFIREANALTVNASTMAGDIDVRNATGDMTVGVVFAPGQVALHAGGAILDGNGVDNNVSADMLDLLASNGIGSGGDGLETSVNTLTADGGASGGLLIANNKALTLMSAAATGGAVSISAAGSMTLAGAMLATGQNVTLTANGALIDANVGNDITALGVTLNASKIGTSGDKIETTTAAITAATTTGGIFLSNTGATLALAATALGQAADIDIDTTGDIVLGAVTAQGDTVKLRVGVAGSISDGNDPNDPLPPFVVNVTAKKIDIVAAGGIGTALNPVEMDVDVVVAADGGAPGAFVTFTGPLLLTEAALEAAGSGTLTFDAESITIEDIADNTATIASGRSLVLRTPTGHIVFLDTADTIQTSGIGTITVQAGTVAGSGGCAVLGNLETAGGNILVQADLTITIGLLDAGAGDVTVQSLHGIIIDGNGAALNVMAGTTTLSGAGRTARENELDEEFNIAAAAGAKAEAAAEQTAADALGDAKAILDAEVATQTAMVATDQAAADILDAQYAAEQSYVNDLTITNTSLNVAAAVAQTAALIAGAIAAPAQAIPFTGDFGAQTAADVLNVVAVALADAAALEGIALTVESIKLVTIGVNDTTADFTLNSAQDRLALAMVTQQAFAESSSITLAAAAKAAIVRDASERIRDQAVLARDQANVIGTFATPLGLQVTGVINVTAGPTDSYLQVVGPTALNQIVATGSVTLISTGAITNGAAPGTPNIIATGLTISAVGGIGTVANHLTTQVGTLNATNTAGGDIEIANNAAAPGPLDITGISNAGGGHVFISNKGITATGQGITVSGPITATGAGADLTIQSGSPMTIAADVSMPGPVVLAAGETPAAGDDLTVNAGVTVESTGSSVTLRAGDNVTVPTGATIKANSTITITASYANDPGDTGANVVVEGTLVATSALIGVDTAAQDGNDNDTFTITPSVSTPITVDGGTGSDILNFNADGLAVTILGNMITAAGRAAVTFNNFEFVNILNANGGGSITLNTAPGGADTLILTGTGQESGTITLNGGIPISFNGTTSFFFNAGDMDDTATVSPYATSTLPWKVAVTIDGGAGTDRIIYNNVAGLTENTRVTATALQAGRIESPGVTSASNDLVVLFSNVENITANANPGEDDKLTVNLRDTAAADTAILLFDPDAGDDDIQLVGLFNLVVDTANYIHLTINGNGGDDTFNLALVGPGGAAGGTLPIPLTINGGLPFASDTLIMTGNANLPDTFTITPGPDNQSGLATIAGTDTGTLTFTGIENISLDGGGGVGTDRMILQGTPVANEFTLKATGSVSGTAQVDAGPAITFSAFGTTSSAIDLNGREGSDTFSVSPVGFVGITTINVDGGDPTASDILIVNGSAGADTTVNVSPTAADAATITGLGATINVTTTEHLIYNGLGGGDNLTVTTPSGGTVIDLTPGALYDQGTLAMRQFLGAGGAEMLPIAFTNLGDGTLTLADFDNARVDELQINGTAASNVFTVDAAGQVRLSKQAPINDTTRILVPVNTPGVTYLELLGLDGDETFNVAGNHPFASGILLDGGNPSASDVLNFNGAGAAITVDLAATTVAEAAFGAVQYLGMERVNIISNNATSSLTVNGTSGDDEIDFRPVSAGNGSFTASSTGAFVSTQPFFTYVVASNSPITIGSGGGYDTLGLIATAGNDVINAVQTSASALSYTQNAFTQAFSAANLKEVKIEALNGDDLIRVSVADALEATPASSWRFTVDGGPPNASDRLIVNDDGVGDLTILRQASDGRSGSATVGALNPVVYTDFERVDITPVNPVTGGTGTGNGGRIVVFHTDPFEYNDTRVNAGPIERAAQNATSPSIDPGGLTTPFAVNGDEDWYVFRPQATNTFQIGILWSQITTVASGRPGLPGGGNLSLDIYDAYGSLIVAGTTLVDPRNENGVVTPAGGHQANTTAIFGATDDPAFPQFNTIYVRVKGTGNQPTPSINVYDFDNLSGIGSGTPGVGVVDNEGPQVISVNFPADPAIDIFVPKPINGPSPLVQSLAINFVDLPPRAPGFLYGAIDPALFAGGFGQKPAMGLFKLVGDSVGNVPIVDVELVNDPVVVGQIATATVFLFFDTTNPDFEGGLPDDRYTLVVLDGLYDPPGNKLDGESNAGQPVSMPSFPSGNGQAGGDFVARFTVDARPHIGTFGNGTMQLDVNGNGIWDPVNPDATNADKAFNFGRYTDNIFAGNFAPAGTNGNGFDKLGAYGLINGQFRFLLATGGVIDNVLTISPSLQINGKPLAYKFNPTINADEIAIFDGNGNWYIDYAHTNTIGGAGTIVVQDSLRGYPVVGDFDGDGNFDLAVYQPDNNIWQFDLNPLTGHRTFTTFQWGFSGVMERPIAADMNHDGVTDIGLSVPTSVPGSKSPTANYYFLESPGPGALPGFIPGPNSPFRNTVNAIAHSFDPAPFAQDHFFNFGSGFYQPIVGIWDPPSPQAPAVLKLAPKVSLADVSLSTFVDTVPSGGYAGLVARRSTNGKNEFWGGLVRTGNTYTAQIKLYLNGAWQLLASASIPGLTPRSTVKFEVVGTSLELSLNGKLVVSVANATLRSAGAAGIYAEAGSVIWPAQATAVARPLAALPVNDSFDQPNGKLLSTAWDEWSGSFRSQSSVLTAQAANNIATLHSATLTDSIQSIEIKAIPAGGYAALVSRSNTAADSYYRAGLLSVYDAKTKKTTYLAQIWRKQGTKWTQLVSKSVASGVGTITFVTVGSSQQLYLNGTLVAASSDTVLKSGVDGIAASQSVRLDNYSANLPSFLSTSLPYSTTFLTGTTLDANWYSNAGAFTVTNNRLAGIAANNEMTLYGASQLNVSVQAQLMAVAAGTSAGLLARYNAGTGNTYWAGIVSTYNSDTKVTTYSAQIKRRVNGVWTVLFSKATSVHAGLIQFNVSGSLLSLSVGNLVGSVHDWTLAAPGTVGLSGGAGSQFSSFSATQ